jgi:MFS family permease
MMAGGRAAAAVALLLLIPLPVHDISLPLLMTALALLGFGNVCTFVASSVAATSGVDSHELGLASGLLYTAQQVGAAVGISALIALAATRAAFLQQTGTDPTSALVDGFRLALAGGAIISVLAAAVALADCGRDLGAGSPDTSCAARPNQIRLARTPEK